MKTNVSHIFFSVIIIIALFYAGYIFFSGGSQDDPSVKKDAELSASTTGVVIQAGTVSSSPITSQTDITHNTTHMVTIDTNYGTIVFETYDADAPNTVANFIKLAEKGFYNGVIFHRVIKGFMIQGGDPTGTGTGGPGYTFADELNPDTSSYKAGYKKGVVAMANAGPNTNGSQFFIMAADYPLPNNYTIFGKVVSGQDVVDTIDNVQTGANDKPVTPVVMKSVTVK